MKLISWNVNGLRACVNKGFKDFFLASDADLFALQETKLQEGQIDLSFEGIPAIGTALSKRVTQVWLSLRKRNLCRSSKAWGSRNMIRKGVC